LTDATVSSGQPNDCVLCPPNRRRRVREGGVTDWRCHDRMVAILHEIPERYLKLDPSPGGSGTPERRAPGFRSTPPLNLHVVALRDPRTDPIEPGDPHCALAAFRSWANLVRRHREQALHTGRSIVSEGEYLAANIDWITRQPWVPAFAAEIEVVCSQLRAANGDPNPKPVGWCIELITDAETGAREFCGFPLFPPREGDDLVKCGGCGSEYDPLRQIRFRLANEADPEPPTPACTCGHADAQHDNDSPVGSRGCHVRWCPCEDYRTTAVEEVAA